MGCCIITLCRHGLLHHHPLPSWVIASSPYAIMGCCFITLCHHGLLLYHPAPSWVVASSPCAIKGYMGSIITMLHHLSMSEPADEAVDKLPLSIWQLVNFF
jgi:hypothetical protein